ncbi:MAG: 1,4-dihydroxy-2-naphthoate octaprenyltransferase [Epsilonproteobacteria bacterium]|nr:MAG: 1,4-dihydroxy-2-naphthoate octaprenyltransferase [Campylobacterota bacterium]RLA65756.1 MAG: 1,4-dihydroxy-2-naphthoate octaprenyltransferase [Campylobacterota bacterium]
MNIKPYLLAVRPKTLTASIGPVLLGLFFSQYEQGHLNFFIAVLTLLCTLFMQMGTNLVNDYFDFKRGIDGANRLGPTRATQAGLIKPHLVKIAYQIIFGISFMLGIFLMWHGGLPIVLIGLASLLAAYAYTGGPIPLSHYGLGEILALLFFGPIAVWGTYFLQTNSPDLTPLFLGLGPGLISATIMGVNNLRDLKSDQASGKFTLAVFLGEKKMKTLLMIFIFLSGALPIFYMLKMKKITLILPFLALLLFRSNWKRIYIGPIDAGLNQALAKTGQYMFIYGLLFGLGFIL